MPVCLLVFICVETIYLAEGVKSRFYFETVAFLLRQQSKKLVVLGSKFKDSANAEYHVFKIGVKEWLSIPLVTLLLGFPKLASHLCSAIFPTTANSHTLVEFDSDIGERGSPDIVLLEFPLNASAQGLSCHFEKVFHAGLWVGGEDILISPYFVAGVLDTVNKRADLSKFERV